MVDVEIFDILTYDYDKMSPGIAVIDTVYPGSPNSPAVDQPQARVTGMARGPGMFEYGISLTVNFDKANDRVDIRFSIDGGVGWHEFVVEAKDTSEVRPVEYLFPYEITGSVAQDFIVQARSELGDNGVPFMDAWIKRVG